MAHRNRVLIVTLLAVGGVFALLTGIGGAQGNWVIPQVPNSSQPPHPRFGAASTFDEANGDLLIFGGFVGTTTAPGSTPGTGVVAGPPIVTDGKTWAMKLASGRWLNRTESAIHSPSPRGFASMAYDRARKNVVLFGGALYRTFTGSAVSGETWTWDGQDWTLQNPPAPRPVPRQNASMVYDAHRKVVMMFGGRDADNKPLQDTWIWNGSTWKIMPSAGAPSPRHSAAMAYNVCRAEAVMFGGIGDPVNNFVSQPGETWLWDGAKWRTPNAPPLLSPPRRIGGSMVYSPVSGRVLLYGGLAVTETGQATGAVDTDVWRWTEGGATGWERMNNESALALNALNAFALGVGVFWVQPPPRAYASFTPATVSGNSYTLFGGTPSADLGTAHSAVSAAPQVALGDQYGFGEAPFAIDTDRGAPLTDADTPLRNRCDNPVPIPPDDTAGITIGPEAPKVSAREGMREIDQVPVLLGTDWPQARRNTHTYSGTYPNLVYTPDPNHIPPPECPNRSADKATSGNIETGKDTHLVTDQKRNRVYQFFICDPDRGLGYYKSPGQQNPSYQRLPLVHRVLIKSYDGTTLKPLAWALAAPVGITLGFNQTFLGDMLIHDVDRGRFLIRSIYHDGSTFFNDLVVIQQDLIEKGVDPVVRRTPLAGPLAQWGSFFDHPKTGRPKLLILRSPAPSSVPGQTNPPRLAQVDFENNSVDWEADATGCIPGFFGRPMRSGNNVYNACSVPGTNRSGVVRISITENPDGSETPGTAAVFIGPYRVAKNWGDPQAERMLLLSDTYGGQVLWIFDGETSRYVGRAGISSFPPGGSGEVQFGFDQEIGRLYAHTRDDDTFVAGEKFKNQGGMLVLDTRLTPVPQGNRFPQFVLLPAAPVASLPVVKGAPRRVFIRGKAGQMKKYPNGEYVDMPNEMFYRTLADEVQIPGKAELSQLDALTIPVAETPGKTEVSFDAEGSGYGIRLRSIGGIRSALMPFQQISDSEQGLLVESLLLDRPRPAIPACIFPDRELMAGWVPQARLSDLDALARSTGLEVDSNSKTDLEGPFSRCNPTANAAILPPSARVVFEVLWPLWQMVQYEGNKAASSGAVEVGKDADGSTTRIDTPLGSLERGEDKDGKPTAKVKGPVRTGWDHFFKEVECVGDALATNHATVGNIYGSAECVQRNGLVKATARGSATGAGPLGEEISSRGFSVGEGYSTVTVNRDPVNGVVVTSTAVARGIQLPGASFGAGNLASLSIDRVETKAVAWSNGRPGEERANFTRIICGVHTPDGSIPGCLTAAQQNEFVTRWNSGWGMNSKMSLPKPDPEYYQGSPGGYIAGVIKPVADELEDQLFAKDYQREVPGLVIEFYKDSQSQGPGRQVLQLAATRAVAGLGVQCNPEYFYSPEKNDCLPVPDDLLEEEFFEEDEEEFFEDEESELDGEWTAVEAIDTGESLGSKIGRLLDRLPVIRQLPIRQMGEALLAASVWVLLGLPLLFAWRRLSLTNP